MAFNLALFESQGAAAMLQCWRCFAPHALERFFAEHTGVLDLGGGLERSCQVLASRTSDPEEQAFQRYAIEHGMLQRLATPVVYAGARPPERLADEVVRLLGAA